MAGGKLGDLLVSQGMITKAQLETAVADQSKKKSRLLSSLVKLGHVNEKVLATFLSKQYGIAAVSLEDYSLPEGAKDLVPISLCEKHGLVPLGIENNRVVIALSDPTNIAAVDDVRFLCNRDVVVYLSTESGIRLLTERTYRATAAPIDTGLNEKIDSDFNGDLPGGTNENTATVNVNIDASGNVDKPAIKLINQLLVEAIRRHASDIHIEPYEDHSRVRLRVDGSLYEVMRIPMQLKQAVPARIKVLSNLNISEKRLPQDGRIQVKMNETKTDIRVSTLPTMFGEKVVMRVLDAGTASLSLLQMGFEESQLAIFRKAASQPYGMILVTGPTGSGKSTTLYAALGELNKADVNISTVEDPVEYNVAGINQVQVKDGIGLTFAASLRSLLRQDPDIILVGEIRDQETAEIAIKSALTGHMVFSTLHTNDAPSTITRLIHMGIEPFLITAALTLVQAQRLIRINCEKCREPDSTVTTQMMLDAGVPQDQIGKFQPTRGRGCDRCGTTGYKGRRGIFEIMPMTERLRGLVVKGGTADIIRSAALEDGLVTLRQSALFKFYRGDTSLEEVMANSRLDDTGRKDT